MLTRETGYLTLRRPGSGSAAAKQLQAEGYVVLEQVFGAKTVDTLADEVERIYEEYPPDERSVALPTRALGAVPLRDAQPERRRAEGDRQPQDPQQHRAPAR